MIHDFDLSLKYNSCGCVDQTRENPFAERLRNWEIRKWERVKQKLFWNLLPRSFQLLRGPAALNALEVHEIALHYNNLPTFQSFFFFQFKQIWVVLCSFPPRQPTKQEVRQSRFLTNSSISNSWKYLLMCNWSFEYIYPKLQVTNLKSQGGNF